MDEKKKEELCAQAGENGRNYYKSGLNCSECSFKAWLDLNVADFSPDVIAIASGFGGGVGKSGGTCGAVCGGMMALGTMKGRRNPLERPDMTTRVAQLDADVYPRAEAYMAEVKEKLGALTCDELCAAYDMASTERKRNCKRIVGICAETAAKHALKD